MVMTPMMDQRVVLWGFKGVPELTYKLNVKGPLIGERDIPQFAFIRAMAAEILRDTLVLPRRTHISFDYEYLGRDVSTGQPPASSY